MGKVEKVIVLSVLFLIALILVVSLTVDDPLDKSRIVEAGAPKGQSAAPDPTVAWAPGSAPGDPSRLGTVPGAPQPTRPQGLLSAEVQPGTTPAAQAAPPATPPAAPATVAGTPPSAIPELPAGSILKTLDGLRDSILRDMKLYTVQENDTYRAIADKYYGDWTRFTVLRRSNEGRNEIHPGDVIFVPVFDADAPAVAQAPAGGNDKAGKPAARATGGKVHVVKEGESLWKIASKELGSGARWEEIYELNKDVMANPKALKAGLRLRIP